MLNFFVDNAESQVSYVIAGLQNIEIYRIYSLKALLKGLRVINSSSLCFEA